MFKYLTWLMAVSFSLMAMEISDYDDKKLDKYNENSDGLKKFEEIIRDYTEIAKNEINEEFNIYININEIGSQLKPLDFASKSLGKYLLPTQEDAHFFVIKYQDNANLSSLLHAPDPLKKLYKFFEEKKLTSHVGYIFAPKLKNARLFFPEQNLLKKLASKLEENCFRILAKDNLPEKYFHNNLYGFLLRNRDTKSNIKPEFFEFFKASGEAQNKINDVLIIINEKRKRVVAAQKILTDHKQNPKTGIEKIIESNLFPEIFNKRIKKESKEIKPLVLVNTLLKYIPPTLNALNAQETVLKNNIFPGKIDLVLLYLFYLFDDGTKDIFSHEKVLIGMEKPYDFNASLSDIEELSITSNLSEFAHKVLFDLGVDLNDIILQKTSNVIDKNEKQAVRTKQNKQYKQKCNNKKQHKPKKRNQLANVGKKNMNKEIIDEDLDDNNITFASIKNNEIISINIIEPLLSNVYNFDDYNDKNTAIEIVPECKHGEELFKFLPAQNITKSKKGLRYSLSDNNDQNNLILKRGKVHRALDNFSQLLASELSCANTTSGSLSMALAYDKNQEPKLIISTKSNRAKKELIIYSLNEMKKHIDKFHRNKINGDIKTFIFEQKQLLKTATALPLRRQITFNINYANAFRFLHSTFQDNRLSHDLQSILMNVKSENIVVLDNTFNFHSEIIMSAYLLSHGLLLDNVFDKNGQKTPYQYIGGNILNCGKCNIIIRGGNGANGFNIFRKKSGMVIFTRGHYETSYVPYIVPTWFTTLTNQRKNEVYNALSFIENSANLIKDELYRSQMPDVDSSDTDDDELNVLN